MMNIAHKRNFIFIPVGDLSNIFFNFPPKPECNVRIKSRIRRYLRICSICTTGTNCLTCAFSCISLLLPWLSKTALSKTWLSKIRVSETPSQGTNMFSPNTPKAPFEYCQIPLNAPCSQNCTKIPFTICHHQQWNELQDRLQVPNNYCISLDFFSLIFLYCHPHLMIIANKSP